MKSTIRSNPSAPSNSPALLQNLPELSRTSRLFVLTMSSLPSQKRSAFKSITSYLQSQRSSLNCLQRIQQSYLLSFPLKAI